MTPHYPIYIPSKGRYGECKTALLFEAEGVPYRLVVEPQEVDEYTARFGVDRVLALPFSNLGRGSIPARNWIKEHATAEGHKRHWQWDDNIRKVGRYYSGKRLRCAPLPAICATEDFVDRYENIAVAGLNYMTFCIPQRDSTKPKPPFQLNTHVYSCTLTLNSTPHQWRGRYNEDTDYCLQVLADGWCTVLVNAFWVDKQPTMTMKGGNSDELYRGDGRLHMAQELARRWPRIVEVKRRWGRPQHVVNWKKFRTELKRRDDIDWAAIEAGGPNDYGLQLVKVK